MEDREDNLTLLIAKALEQSGEAKALALQAVEEARESLRLREESQLVFEGIRSTIKTFLSIISVCTFTMGIIRAIPVIASWLG